MLTRYDVRYNCYRMKKGNTPKNQEIIDQVNTARGKFSWEEFADTWDVAVKGDQILAFASIKDVNAVTEVCAKKQMITEMGVDKEWTPEEDAIIQMIESQFLEGIMDWSGYKKTWRVKWDDDQKRITTELLNLPKTQTEVTQELVDKKLREQIASAKKIREQVAKTFDTRPMTEDEIGFYTRVLANKLH